MALNTLEYLSLSAVAYLDFDTSAEGENIVWRRVKAKGLTNHA